MSSNQLDPLFTNWSDGGFHQCHKHLHCSRQLRSPMKNQCVAVRCIKSQFHQSPPASKYQCPSTRETNLWCGKCHITTFESQKVVVSVSIDKNDKKQLFKSPMAFNQPLEYQVAVIPRNHFQRVSHICIENALSLYMVSGWQYEKCSVGHHPHQFL